MDWARESRDMKAIYQNSILTIAVAPTGDHTQSGIFSKRIGGHTWPVELPLDEKQSLFAFKWVEMEHDNLSELDTRGWTLQERLLSPRVAIYKSGQLYFECGWHTVSESQPSKDSQRIDEANPDFWAALFRMRFTYDSQPQNQLSDVWERCWRGIVENYSARRLTFGKDRMIALNGIVEELYEKKRDTYLVGLWQDRICEHLLWQIKEKVTQHASTGFDAPSWSWLSALYPVTYRDVPSKSSFASRFGMLTTYDMDFIDAEINTDNTFSKVTGRLFLQGRVTEVYQRSNDSRRLYFTTTAPDSNEEDAFEWHADQISKDDRAIWLLKVLSNDFGACFLCIVPASSEDTADGRRTHFLRQGVCRIIVPNKLEWENRRTNMSDKQGHDADEGPDKRWGRIVKDMDKAVEVAHAEKLLDRIDRGLVWSERIVLE